MQELQQSIWPMAKAFALVAAAAGLPTLLMFLRDRRASLFPRSAGWEVPWNGWAVLAGFIAVFLAAAIMQAGLNAAGFFQSIYGPKFPIEPGPAEAQATHARALWGQTLGAPLVFAVVVAGLRLGAGATWSQIGLSRQRLPMNLVAGYLTWLVVTPAAFAVFFAAQAIVAPNPDKHPLMDLGEWAGRREAIVFAIQAVILMPAVEELAFRGLLLPWSAMREAKGEALVPPSVRPHLVYAVAFFFCTQTTAAHEVVAERRWNDLPQAFGAAIFLLALLPGYVLLPLSGRWRRRLHLPNSAALRACFSNAALFAAVHANVWPSPIPLFVLGFGLAWLALRTHSILPAFLGHALFNAIAVVYQQMGPG